MEEIMRDKINKFVFYAGITTYLAFIGSIIVGAIYMFMDYGN